MKKRLLSLLLTFIVVVCFSAGCSCNDAILLSFTQDFNGGHSPSKGFSEVCEYNVSYANDYEGNFAKNVSASADVFSVEYSNGKYTTVLEIPESGYYDELLNLHNSDIKGKIEEGYNVFRLKTTFTIDVKWTIKGESKTATDTITSAVYFCPQQLSFAPIYSQTDSTYTIFSVNSENAAASNITTKNVIKYNLDSFTRITDISSFAYSDPENVATDTKTVTCDYEFKTVIDNAQLLFVMRNMNIAEESSSSLPTVSSSYDNATELSVRNAKVGTLPVEATLNESAVSESVPVKNLAYNVANANTSGTSQFAVIQSAASASIANRGLLLKYAHPLINFNNAEFLGALIYNLTNVTFNA